MPASPKVRVPWSALCALQEEWTAKGEISLTIADLHELAPDAEIACDVCIIGSGPAGATIARELAQSPAQVIVLESGGAERQPPTDELNEIQNIGWPREQDQWLLRNRIIGGVRIPGQVAARPSMT
jgi:hypothetical protein